ncbi:unnamed protein product [Discosporangium mesarthrocarpum]
MSLGSAFPLALTNTLSGKTRYKHCMEWGGSNFTLQLPVRVEANHRCTITGPAKHFLLEQEIYDQLAQSEEIIGGRTNIKLKSDDVDRFGPPSRAPLTLRTTGSVEVPGHRAFQHQTRGTRYTSQPHQRECNVRSFTRSQHYPGLEKEWLVDAAVASMASSPLRGSKVERVSSHDNDPYALAFGRRTTAMNPGNGMSLVLGEEFAQQPWLTTTQRRELLRDPIHTPRWGSDSAFRNSRGAAREGSNGPGSTGDNGEEGFSRNLSGWSDFELGEASRRQADFWRKHQASLPAPTPDDTQPRHVPSHWDGDLIPSIDPASDRSRIAAGAGSDAREGNPVGVGRKSMLWVGSTPQGSQVRETVSSSAADKVLRRIRRGEWAWKQRAIRRVVAALRGYRLGKIKQRVGLRRAAWHHECGRMQWGITTLSLHARERASRKGGSTEGMAEGGGKGKGKTEGRRVRERKRTEQWQQLLRVKTSPTAGVGTQTYRGVKTGEGQGRGRREQRSTGQIVSEAEVMTGTSLPWSKLEEREDPAVAQAWIWAARRAMGMMGR